MLTRAKKRATLEQVQEPVVSMKGCTCTCDGCTCDGCMGLSKEDFDDLMKLSDQNMMVASKIMARLMNAKK